MKHIQAFISTAICITVLGFAASASGQTVKQGVVTVVRIQGTARYSTGDNVWHPLSTGQTLGANDVVQTAADSTVDLVMGDQAAKVGLQRDTGSPIGGVLNIAGLPKYHTGFQQSAPEQNLIRLQADTVLGIDKFTFSQTGADVVSDTELDLRAGKVFGNIKKISSASQYLIKMPNGVAGIRGTVFMLGFNGDVTVLQGSVVVSGVGVNGQVYTTVVNAGWTFNPQTQQVTRLTATEYLTELQHAKEIVIAVHELVTVEETQTANGQDTTTLVVSPTSGNSRTIIINRH